MNDIRTVGMEEIVVPPRRSAEVHPNQTIAMLAKSIRIEGKIKEPLIMRPVGQKYELVTGLKRLKAAMRLGHTEIPVDVRELSDEEAERIAFLDNMYDITIR